MKDKTESKMEFEKGVNYYYEKLKKEEADNENDNFSSNQKSKQSAGFLFKIGVVFGLLGVVLAYPSTWWTSGGVDVDNWRTFYLLRLCGGLFLPFLGLLLVIIDTLRGKGFKSTKIVTRYSGVGEKAADADAPTKEVPNFKILAVFAVIVIAVPLIFHYKHLVAFVKNNPVVRKGRVIKIFGAEYTTSIKKRNAPLQREKVTVKKVGVEILFLDNNEKFKKEYSDSTKWPHDLLTQCTYSFLYLTDTKDVIGLKKNSSVECNFGAHIKHVRYSGGAVVDDCDFVIIEMDKNSFKKLKDNDYVYVSHSILPSPDTLKRKSPDGEVLMLGLTEPEIGDRVVAYKFEWNGKCYFGKVLKEKDDKVLIKFEDDGTLEWFPKKMTAVLKSK